MGRPAMKTRIRSEGDTSSPRRAVDATRKLTTALGIALAR